MKTNYRGVNRKCNELRTFKNGKFACLFSDFEEEHYYITLNFN